MVSLKWCCKQKEGIKIIEPNDNLAKGYLKMAENSLGTMNREKQYNLTFAISACYYSMYYSLYAICMKLGIKCEIHSCTIEFMKKLLDDFYSKDDVKTIKKAFDTRNIAQYYADKIIPKEDIDTENSSNYLSLDSRGTWGGFSEFSVSETSNKPSPLGDGKTQEVSDFIISEAPLFFTKSREILAKINEEKTGVIRRKIEEF